MLSVEDNFQAQQNLSHPLFQKVNHSELQKKIISDFIKESIAQNSKNGNSF